MGVPADKKEEKPYIDFPPGLGIVFDAWEALQGDRPQSMGESLVPLPFTAVHLLCEASGLDAINKLMLMRSLRALDRAILDHYNNKDKDI